MNLFEATAVLFVAVTPNGQTSFIGNVVWSSV
jgi:hypothetical protein